MVFFFFLATAEPAVRYEGGSITRGRLHHKRVAPSQEGCSISLEPRDRQVGKELGGGNCVWAGGGQRPNRQLVFAN